jgi:hypothetical protein
MHELGLGYVKREADKVHLGPVISSNGPVNSLKPAATFTVHLGRRVMVQHIDADDIALGL